MNVLQLVLSVVAQKYRIPKTLTISLYHLRLNITIAIHVDLNGVKLGNLSHGYQETKQNAGELCMEDRLYKTVLLYTKLSPPAVQGVIPRIRKKKLLEKLARYNIKESDLNKSSYGYYVWLEKDLLLEIIRR